jgi:hypothetical protein
LLANSTIYAQSPGGISGNLRGWYDASSGVTLSGGVVSQWNDRTANGFNGTQGTAGRRPAATGLINYNTALVFDGADDFLNISDLMATGTTGVTAFAVAQQTSLAGDDWGTVLLGQTNSASWSGGGYGLTALNIGKTAFGFWVTAWNANFVSYNTTLSSPALMTGSWNGTTASNVQYFQDGTSRGTDAYAPGTVGDGGNSYIGSGVGSGTEFCFAGNIAEIAVYNTGLNTASVNQVESYLALKYGITLSTNYVNSAATQLYATTSPYNVDIMGVGRDDGSGLIQKQSHSSDDSSRVFISTLAASNSANGGSFTSNHQYVVMGSDGGKMHGGSNEKPASLNSRIQREWKVTNTGFTGTFGFAMKLDASGVPGSVNPAHLRLLVDDDGNFTNASIINSGITIAYSNPVITVTGIDNTLIPANSIRYITIGSNVASTPLPVELTDFDAELCDDYVCVKWQTASEKENNHFELDRSQDVMAWQNLTTVKGKGTALYNSSYDFTDEQPFHGVSYYRLKQVDDNGAFKYAPVISINNQAVKETVKIFPNPANDVIQTNTDLRQMNYKLIGINGEDLTRLLVPDPSDEEMKFNCASVPEGFYILHVYDNTGQLISSSKVLVDH